MLSNEESQNKSIHFSIDSKSFNSSELEIQKSNIPEIYDGNDLVKKETKYILCKKCGIIPILSFQNFHLINISCECLTYENESIEKFYDYIFTLSNDKIRVDNYTCKIHLNKKFQYYCRDCKFDICKDCIAKDGNHKTHLFVPLLDCEKKYEKIKEYKENEYFNEIMKLIKETYDEFPVSSLYKTIENAYNLISKNLDNNQNFNFIETKREIRIRYLKELNDIRNKNIYQEIVEIQIIRQDLFNLKPLCNFEFRELKLLNLSENNIDDISPLKNMISPKLECLILLKNKLSDKNIEYLKDFKFAKLKTLNLFDNYLTDFQFFDEIKVFPNLKVLYIGKNTFDENIRNIDFNSKKYNFPNLESLGATKGVFSNESIKNLACFKFPKLKILYLSGNNLSSLSFIEQIECPELDEIWLNDNDLTNFTPLIKFENIDTINLDNNKIDSLESLTLFLEKTKLKKFLISNNKIDSQKEKAIIDEIKKKIELKLNYS